MQHLGRGLRSQLFIRVRHRAAVVGQLQLIAQNILLAALKLRAQRMRGILRMISGRSERFVRRQDNRIEEKRKELILRTRRGNFEA